MINTRRIASSLFNNRSQSGLDLVTPRENEFNERTWWNVDLAAVAAGTPSPQGATALVKRCMRRYGWDETKARKVLAAYRQFLALKKKYIDWNDNILSPCYLVHEMWYCHILDVVNYYHDMILLCGHVVGHNPDGALDIETKKKRQQDTRRYLMTEFGEYDEEIWGEYSPNNAARARAVRYGNAQIEADSSSTKSGAALSRERDPGPADAEIIEITVKELPSMETTDFKIIRTKTRMSRLFDAYAKKKGINDASILRFFTADCKTIVRNDTAASLHLHNDDKIGCVQLQTMSTGKKNVSDYHANENEVLFRNRS